MIPSLGALGFLGLLGSNVTYLSDLGMLSCFKVLAGNLLDWVFLMANNEKKVGSEIKVELQSDAAT